MPFITEGVAQRYGLDLSPLEQAREVASKQLPNADVCVFCTEFMIGAEVVIDGRRFAEAFRIGAEISPARSRMMQLMIHRLADALRAFPARYHRALS